jgi:hypothetical protein
MIRLGLRLIGGDRESLARLAVTAVSVALGVGLLLASLASMNAVNSQDARGAWLSTQPGSSSDSANAAHSSALWWSAINDEFEGQTIYRIDVATTGPRSPVPPGMTRLPRASQYFVSPALARLLASTPAAELGDRFPGREVGTIGAAGLPNPNALIVVVGYSAHQLSRIPGAEQITSIAGPGTPNSSGSNSEQFVIVLVIAALALLFPVLVFLATATRLAAARREQRFAAMRLVGATPRQISTIAAVEALAAAVIGVVLGFVLFVIVRPALQHVPITGAPFAPGDLSLRFADILLVAIGVPLSALFTARAALRRVLISPLGVSRRVTPPAPRPTRLIPLVAGLVCLALLAVVGHPNSKTLVYADFVGFLLMMVGLVTAGPWLTYASARVMTRRTSRPDVLLAGRRLSDNPAPGRGLKCARWATSSMRAPFGDGAFPPRSPSSSHEASPVANTATCPTRTRWPAGCGSRVAVTRRANSAPSRVTGRPWRRPSKRASQPTVATRKPTKRRLATSPWRRPSCDQETFSWGRVVRTASC